MKERGSAADSPFMGFSWPFAKSGGSVAGRPRRQERFITHGLSCPLGTVVDLNGTGMRVRCENKPLFEVGQEVQLTIGSETQSVKVSGIVKWVKRVSWKRFEAGLQFQDVRPGIAAALVQLAQYGFISTSGAPVGSGPAEPQSKASADRVAVKAAMEVEDLYAVLGVAGSASADEIKQAYRNLALKFHPDVSTEAGAAERFSLISKAYSVLKDDSLRRKYDLMLAGCQAAA
jgi:hypothetical protein